MLGDPVYAAEAPPSEPNKVERTAKRAADATERAAKRAVEAIERGATKTDKALTNAAEKTDHWVKEKTK
jgi:chemotaxis regulatin CheY-phosphate phosphatase CheZ